MNNFYVLTRNQETPQLGVYETANIPSAMLTRPLVFVLSIGVLPNLTLDDFDNFENNTSGRKNEENWYNKDLVVGEIR